MVNSIEPERTQAPLQPKPHKKQDKKDKKVQQKIEIELKKKFQVGGPRDILQLQHWHLCIGLDHTFCDDLHEWYLPGRLCVILKLC